MASSRLRKCADYLNLLLNQDRLQGEALIVTANNHQVDCIGEVIKNILRLPVGKRTKQLIAKSKKVLQTLADLAINVKKRLQLLQKTPAMVLELLLSVKNRLKAVLRP
jgi:hypothetical protein